MQTGGQDGHRVESELGEKFRSQGQTEMKLGVRGFVDVDSSPCLEESEPKHSVSPWRG